MLGGSPWNAAAGSPMDALTTLGSSAGAFAALPSDVVLLVVVLVLAEMSMAMAMKRDVLLAVSSGEIVTPKHADQNCALSLHQNLKRNTPWWMEWQSTLLSPQHGGDAHGHSP